MPVSAETRAKISAAMMGNQNGKGHTHVPTPETRARMSAAQLGKTLSPEHRAKIGAKASVFMLGKQNALGYRHSAESKARMSVAQRGKVLSPEHRAVLRASRLGSTHSPETRAKMRASNVTPRAPIGSKINNNGHGYVLIKTSQEPDAPYHGWQLEHRYVMEQELGRSLDAEEVVHHIDGDKQNNTRENLQLFDSLSAHRLHHVRERVA